MESSNNVKKETFFLNVARKKLTPLRKIICMLHIKILEMQLFVASGIARLYIFRNSLKKTELNLRKSGKELDL